MNDCGTTSVNEPVRSHANYVIASLDTRASLLERLKRATGEEGWARFFNLYWKLIYNTARKGGLTDDEAQDVVQNTMITVSRHIGQFEYKGEQGSFKAWLMRHTHCRIVDELRKRNSTVSSAQWVDEIEEDELPIDAHFEEIWEAEWKQNLVTVATEQVKKRVNARVFQIYSFCVLQGHGSKRTAAHLNISRATVYIAVHRVSKIMAARTKELKKEFEKK